MERLSQAEWSDNIQTDGDSIIIDVRTSLEVSQGYIPNSVHIDIMNAGQFMEQVNELDKSKKYYIYCRAGGRSAQACMIMNSLGFQNTYNLEGGIEQWKGEIIAD